MIQFCAEHDGNEGPVILSEKLSRETREKLRKRQSQNYPQGFHMQYVLLMLNNFSFR